MNTRMNFIEKSLLLIFALIMIQASFCIHANAEEVTLPIGGKSGDLDWSIDEDGLLTISGEGDYEEISFYDESYYYISGPEWLKFRDYITKVRVNVSGINTTKSMFYGCNKMDYIDLSHLDTTNVTDMTDMFFCCDGLKEVDVSRFDTSKVNNMYEMFCGCSNLETIDVSSFDTSNVTSMYGMFINCRKLRYLDLSIFNTTNVTDMMRMFCECNELKSIFFGSSFDTSKVNNMYEMFCGCSNLETIDVSGFDTSKVTNMQDMFCKCNALEQIDVSSFNTSKVTNMDGMFMRCNKLKQLDLGNFNTCSVKSMNSMFYECVEMETLIFGKGFDTANVTIMNFMFYDCKKIKELDLDKFNTKSVNQIYQMFYNCNELENLKVKGFLKSLKVTNLSYLFYGCSKLEQLDISELNSSDVTNMKMMFGCCYKLKTIDLSSLDTSKVIDMSGMFYHCNSLSSLNLTNFIIGNDTDASNMFGECYSLEKISMPANVKADIHFPIVHHYTYRLFNDFEERYETFYTEPKWFDENNVECEYVKKGQSGCIEYHKIEDLNEIRITNGTCGDNARWQLVYSISDGYQVLKISGTGMMYDYPGELPDWAAYGSGGGIGKIIIEEGIEGIGNSVFDFGALTKYKTVVIPKSVTYINDDAFGVIFLDNELFEIVCYENSEAHEFAINNGLKYSLIEENNIGNDNKNEINESDGDLVYIDDNDNVELPPAVIVPIQIEDTTKNNTLENQVIEEANTIDVSKKIVSDGDSLTVDNATYKVLSLKNSTVSFVLSADKKSSISIPSTIKVYGMTYKVTRIEDCAFKNNTRLKKVKIGSNITEIGNCAFQGCKNLTSVKIGNGVTTIGNNAFEGCKALKSITIEKNVTKIGKRAFYNCKSLKKIHFKTTKLKSVGSKALKNINKNYKVKVKKKYAKKYMKLTKGKIG